MLSLFLFLPVLLYVYSRFLLFTRSGTERISVKLNKDSKSYTDENDERTNAGRPGEVSKF